MTTRRGEDPLVEARRVVDIFRGRGASHNAWILKKLAEGGPLSAYDLWKITEDLDQKTVYRRLRALESEEYIEATIKISKKGGTKAEYRLTGKGLSACAFLNNVDEKTLSEAEFVDYFGYVYTRKERLEEADGNRMAVYVDAETGKSKKVPRVKLQDESIPYRIRLQLDYVRGNLPALYLQTSWGKDYIGIIKNKNDVMKLEAEKYRRNFESLLRD